MSGPLPGFPVEINTAETLFLDTRTSQIKPDQGIPSGEGINDYEGHDLDRSDVTGRQRRIGADFEPMTAE